MSVCFYSTLITHQSPKEKMSKYLVFFVVILLCMVCTKSSVAQTVMADKAKALAPGIGKWKGQPKQSDNSAYIDCNWEINETLKVCDVYSDADMEKLLHQEISGYNPLTSQYYFHSYTSEGIVMLDMFVNDNGWVIQGNVPSPQGQGFMRVVVTLVDENTADVVTYLSVEGTDPEVLQEIRVVRMD